MEYTSAERDTGKSSTVAAAAQHRRSGIIHDFAALLILAATSVLAGGLLNAGRAQPLPWVYQSPTEKLDLALAQTAVAPEPAGAHDDLDALPHEIRLDEFQPYVAEHKGLILDARAAVFYREAHIPGALNLPREGFADDYPPLRATLERSKDGPIVIYCSGADCPDSQLLSDALTKFGYRHLLIYTSGWEEWSQTGLPQEGVSAQP